MNSNIKETYSIQPFFHAFEKTLKTKLGKTKSPLILLQGGFGKHNTGDDTLLLVARNEILKIYPDARIIALCHNPKFLAKDYHVAGIPYKSLQVLKALLKADALIVPAGGLVNNIDYNSSLRSLFNPRGKFVLFTLLLMHLRKKCTVLFGVGIHEIPDFLVKLLLQLVIPRVDLICVRDLYSVKIIKQLGATNYYFSHDPAICYQRRLNISWEVYKAEKNIPFQHYIVLNFRLVKNNEESLYAIHEVSKYLRIMQERYPSYGILLLPFSLHPDFPLENDCYAFQKLLESKDTCHLHNVFMLSEYQTADDVKIIAEHAELLILTRHHAPVLTYECQIPTIIISYNIKCREFAKLGGYKHVIDYSHITCKELLSITDNVLQQKGEVNV